MKNIPFAAKVFQFKNSMMYPVVFVLVLVIVAPLSYSLYISFHNYVLQFGMGKWTGIRNYLAAFKARDFLISMKNTFILTFSVVSVEFLSALGLALILNRDDIKIKKIFTVILMIPIMLPPIAVGLIWKMLLHPEQGIINYLIGFLGIPPLGWYADPKLAMLTVVTVDIWHETSLILIIVLAGLASLDRNPYEAAKVDGASPSQIFFYITLPMMFPIITVAILIRMISAIKTYDLIYIITRGGPGARTDTMSYYVFKMAFRKMSMGDAAAQSFILLMIILCLSVLLIKTTEIKKG